MLRIAWIITRGDAVGGATIHVRDLATALKSAGHDVLVLTGGSGPVTEQFTRLGIPWKTVPSFRRSPHPLHDRRAWQQLRELLREFAPDIVSAHTAKAGWLGRAAARSLGIPCIYTPHGWSISNRLGKAQGLVYTVAEKIAAPWAAAIVCVSESERQLALQKGVGRPEQLHVIHNAVHDVDPSLRARPEAEPPRIACIARFEQPKDHATLIEALAGLTALRWTLDLIGNGPLEPAIREQVQAAGLKDRVRFRGYLADPAPALAEAQLFVLPSRSEGFPRSILEAMRAGLPVVASDVGGVSEAVKHGENGRLVPPGDPVALRSALADPIRDGNLRQRMGVAAHLTYSERFCFNRMLSETMSLYVRFAGERAESTRCPQPS